MPSIRKIQSKKGLRYQVRIRLKGYPNQVKTFSTLKAAQSWGVLAENDIHNRGFTGLLNAQHILFKELSDKYTSEILHKHKGFKQEKNHLKIIRSHLDDYSLGNLSASVLNSYKNTRLMSVSGSSVKKELSLVGRIINFAIKDCGYHLPNGNPINLIRHPKENSPRERRLEKGELQLLIKFSDDFMFSIINILIETGMRRGELCKIETSDINWKKQTVFLSNTKNGSDREVPLTNLAITSLKKLIEQNTNCIASEEPIIFCHPDTLSHRFIKLCKAVGIKDLKLHDLRHESTSRFFEKGLSTMEVSAITGHRDLTMLKRYTHLRAEDLLQRIQ